MPALKDAVLDALRTVEDPDLHKDLVSLNMIRDLEVDDAAGEARFTVCLTTPACPLKDKIKSDCQEAVARVPGIKDIQINMTADVRQAPVDAGKAPIPGVRNIIAVGSGKGGVGKTTTAVNLAVALAKTGARTALLDADLYGPNVPAMLGVTGRPRVADNRIVPLQAHGITVLSMGFMVEESQPLVWRGPMLHGALKQLIQDVAWGQQDYMIIDLPPGTGDVQLSLSQTVPLTGAVIVTTPQNVALQDARKGAAMFAKVDIPVLGVIENMSYYLCPECGHRDEIFDNAGGENAAKKLGVPFLGALPLNTQIREAMDRGRPVAAYDESPFFTVYRDIAQALAQQISMQNAKSGNVFAVIPPS